MVKKVAKKTRKTASVKTSPAKVKRPAKKASESIESFKISSSAPFLVYRITQQTALWGILMAYIFILSVWVLKIQIDTLHVIESINS